MTKPVLARAAERGTADYEFVDLADFPLPHLDEAMPPAMGHYAGEHTKAWAAKISQFDAYVSISPRTTTPPRAY